MSPASEPTLRMVMMAFAGICMVWGILRGIGRLVKFAVSAAAGAVAGWSFFRYAPGGLITSRIGFNPEAVQWGAVVCGVLVFWFMQRFLASLFSGPSVIPSGAGARTRAGLFSLVPALLLVWGAAMALRWSGGVARMRWVQEAVTTHHPEVMKQPPVLAQLRTSVSTGLLGQVLDYVDPFRSRETSALGALIAVRHDERTWQNLLRQPRMAPLLQLDILRPLVKDNDVLHALSFSHYSKLMTLPELTEAVKSPAVRDALRAIPVEDAVRAAIGGNAGLPAIPRAEVVP